MPPARQTAQKLMWYFLSRFDESPVARHRTRRQYQRVDYDVAFVIDSSGSIPKSSFFNGLLALRMLIDRAQADTRYAGVMFSTDAQVHFKYSSPEVAKRELRKMRHMSGWTNTQQALLKCKDDLVESNTSNARPYARKRALIITDGQSNMNETLTLVRALELKQRMVEIFVVAIGDYIPGIHEVVGLASSTDAHLYRVTDYEGLVRVVKLIPRLKKEDTWLADMYQGSQRNRHRRQHRRRH